RPSAATFPSHASRSLELAPRAIVLASAFARCGSPPAAPTGTLMSIPISRLVLLPIGRSLARFEARRIRVGVRRAGKGREGAARKSAAHGPGGACPSKRGGGARPAPG